MHDSIYNIGRLFFQTYWKPSYRRILDIGAYNVNGTLRDFRPEGAEYIGIDLGPGPGVDMVLEDPYKYPFPDQYFDMIVSSSCFEHDPMFWLTFNECCRVLNNAGVIYISAPSGGVYHPYTHDFWRFFPDTGVALERWGQRSGHQIRLVESFMDYHGPLTDARWTDFTGVFSKSPQLDVAPLLSERVTNCSDIRVGSQSTLLKPKMHTSS